MATAMLDARGERSAQGGRFSLTSVCLLLLVAADLAFVAVHVVHKQSPVLQSPLYSLSTDGGFAEIFQYVKTYWIVILLGLLWSRTRERAYLAWMPVFGYLLCDDVLRIHERAGGFIARSLNYRDGIVWAQDFGELTFAVAFGLALFGLISLVYLRGTGEARNVSLDFALLFGVLAFFGVLVDMLHSMVQINSIKQSLVVVEDGGEMLAMSLVCWYVLKRLETQGRAHPWLWQSALRRLSAGRLGPSRLPAQ